jgi:hypothetical protein
MPPTDQHKEEKVLSALDLIRQNKGMKIMRAAYPRVLRRLKGVPRSSSRGATTRKLDIPSSEVLKEYLLMCHALGKGAGIDNAVEAANSILWCQGSDATASRR